MIAKGNLHAHGVKLAAYLTTSYADERAELAELRGFAATNIRDAFIDVQMQAAATRAEKPFFHAYARLPKGEAEMLTRENWQTFADRLEKRLGFDDQPRAVAFHHQANGDTHMHIAWSRIDLASLTAIDPGLYKNKMKQLCREFEGEFGLTKVPNERGADVKTKAADRKEFEQSRRLGSDLKAIRNTIHDCWQSADNGRAFAAAVGEHGLLLAMGDRRDFVVIDRDGGDHALSKRITGATAAATRGKMADIDRASLPSVDDAKATQQAQRKQQPMSEIETPESDQGTASHAAQRDRLVRDAAQLAEAERAQSQMHSARNYREQMERDAEEAKKTENERQQKESSRAAAGDITDAHNRYAQALGSTYTIRDPYGSLANAAMAEYGSFHRQQDALRKDAAAEQDPDKRRMIDLRREIEGHDYMAITSERLAGISRAITMSDNDGARRDDAMAKTHGQMATSMRQERADLQREMREREKDARAATERGGLGSAAQQGAVAPNPRHRPTRSQAEDALRKAAGRSDAPNERDEASRTAQRQDEQTKQREGLRPDQPTESAPPTKEARERSAAEQALRSAAGSSPREPADARDTGRQQGRPQGRGGGRSGR